MNTRAEVFAPATVANLGIGFDILGMAVHGDGDHIVAEWDDSHDGAFIKDIISDGGKLPREADDNVATIAANAVLKQLNIKRGIALTLTKGLPAGSGLGSSSASAVAGAVAVNALLGEPLSKEALLQPSLEGEAHASGGYHADNVAPCLLGGITLTLGAEVEQIYALPIPDGLHLALVTPHVSVATAEARAVLPKQVDMHTMVHQTGNVARLVNAIYQGDIDMMAQAMGADHVVEPARQHLMPYLPEVREKSLALGALTVVISGAGPTLCAICPSEDIAEAVVAQMNSVYESHDMGCTIRKTTPLVEGATVIKVE